MKKSDLKTGMWVQIRKGSIAMVLLDTSNGDILSGETWTTLNSYTEDLKTPFIKEFDIVKVYEPISNMSYLNEFPDIGKSQLKLVWERNDNFKKIAEIRQNIANTEENLNEMKKQLAELEKEGDN